MDFIFQDFRQLLDENLELLLKLRDLTIDWVQEGFQEFFRKLNERFLFLSGKSNSGSPDISFTEGVQGEKVLPGLVLLLAQLSVFIEQSAIPRITEVSCCFYIFIVYGFALFWSIYYLQQPLKSF